MPQPPHVQGHVTAGEKEGSRGVATPKHDSAGLALARFKNHFSRQTGAMKTVECVQFVERGVTAHQDGREYPGLAAKGAKKAFRRVGSCLAAVRPGGRCRVEYRPGSADAWRRQWTWHRRTSS